MLAPAISAALAVHALNGTAIMLIVVHFCFSSPLITTPYPLPAVFFLIPSQQPRTAFFSLFFLSSSISDLSLPFRLEVCQVVVCLLTVPSENVRHVSAHHFRRISNLPLPLRVQCLLNAPNELNHVLLSHRVIPNSPLFSHFAVSTQVYRCTFCAIGE